MTRLIVALLLAAATLGADIVREVRSAIGRGDFAEGERLVAAYRAVAGVTPEMLEALSWLGRGALAAKQYEKAESYAAETRKLTLELLESRGLDDERHLPIALGASIEVQAQVLAARGALSEAIVFLEDELKRWRETSIRTRIQKNIHLLSLEGKPAPPLELAEHLGLKPQPLGELKGKVVLLFFWAHWCGDCKYQGPILARLQREYGDKGLVVVGPTQRYGFAARGQEVSPAEELAYIEQVRAKYYGELEMTAPVSEENFRNYGSSTTPTLVLIDRGGIVRLYHPGRMAYEELAPKVAALL